LLTSSPDRIEQLTRDGWWGHLTLHDYLWQRTAEHPDLLAVADQPDRVALAGGEVVRLSYQELNEAAFNLACQLMDQKIGPGDVVLVQLPNISELVVMYFATSLVGAIISPLPVQYGEHEIKVASDTLSPKALVTLSRLKDTEPARAARDFLAADINVFAFAGAAPEGATELKIDSAENLANHNRVQNHLERYPADANATLTICWTSGTTGDPKGVPRSHNMWFATAQNSSEAAQYRQGDRVLNPFPLVNMAALGGFLFPFVLNGCSLVLHHPFDPPVFLKQMQDEMITFTIVPPAVLNQLAKAEDMWKAFDFRALRRIGSGSAPLAPWMIEVFDHKYGKQIVNFYGSNEGIALFSTPETSEQPEVRASMFPRMGCDDMPWSGVTHEMVGTRVVKVDSEEEITTPGEPGELLFYGATVFDGYYGHSNEDVFTSDGWFRTGDLVEICEEAPNYYRIVGRCKDIINRGGMKISPTELDILLDGMPQVAEAAVCAYRDDDLGERVCACVVPAEGQDEPTLSMITDYLLGKGIAKFKLPEKRLVLDSLPRNPVGKVQRHMLEQRLLESLSESTD